MFRILQIAIIMALFGAAALIGVTVYTAPYGGWGPGGFGWLITGFLVGTGTAWAGVFYVDWTVNR